MLIRLPLKIALAASFFLPHSAILVAAQNVLEEVIVTAQKREQSAQSIPVAVTAISADAIEAMGIQDFSDVVRISPSLTISSGNNKQNTSISIRGIGTNVYSIGVEPSVAVIIDNVSQVQPGQALSNLVDVERIEVLRGPQSTLYGKNASAGLVSVTTKNPADQQEGSLELVLTDDDQTRATGTVSGPLGEQLGYRLMAYYDDRDGYLDNLTYDNQLNSARSKGGRGKFTWDLNEDLSTTVNLGYSKENVNCCGVSFNQLDPDARVLGFLPENPSEGITPGAGNRKVRQDDEPSGVSEEISGSLQFIYNMGAYTLTSISAFNQWEYSNNEDLDLSDLDVAGALSGGAQSGGIVSSSSLETDFFSQEIRLESPLYDTFDFMVGLYYADATTDRSFIRSVLTADWLAEAGTESYSLFGQGNWRITDASSITAGLRFNHEEISVEFDDRPSAYRVRSDDSDSVVTGNISAQHFLNQQSMLYASYARGYKGQAYDISTGFDQEKADNPVKAEDSDAYEVGLKSTLFDQRLQLNIIGFYTEYYDYQAQSTLINPDGSVIREIANVGELETKGIEIDAVALLGENFLLRGGFAWIDATVKEYPNARCFPGQSVAQGCVEIAPGVKIQDLAGKDLNNSPEYKLTLAGEYNLPLHSLPFEGFANFSYRWQDEVNFHLSGDPVTKYGAFDVLDLSIGIVERERSAYRVTLFVNNVFDDDYVVAMVNLVELYAGSPAVGQLLARDSQRYAGLRVKFNF